MSQTSYDPTNKDRETSTYNVLQPAHIRMHNMEAWFWTLTMFQLIPSKMLMLKSKQSRHSRSCVFKLAGKHQMSRFTHRAYNMDMA
jgi:hypothetical protein